MTPTVLFPRFKLCLILCGKTLQLAGGCVAELYKLIFTITMYCLNMPDPEGSSGCLLTHSSIKRLAYYKDSNSLCNN